MLNVYGRIHVDSGPEQLFNILIPFFVARARRVGVGEFIHKDQFWPAPQSFVQIKLLQLNPAVGYCFRRKHRKTMQLLHGLRAGMRLNVADQNVHSAFIALLRILQHGIGFAYARGIAEKDFQPALPLLLIRFQLF